MPCVGDSTTRTSEPNCCRNRSSIDSSAPPVPGPPAVEPEPVPLSPARRNEGRRVGERDHYRRGLPRERPPPGEQRIRRHRLIPVDTGDYPNPVGGYPSIRRSRCIQDYRNGLPNRDYPCSYYIRVYHL